MYCLMIFLIDKELCFKTKVDLQMRDEQLKNYTLVEIEKFSLHRFPSMPFPDETMIVDGWILNVRDGTIGESDLKLLLDGKYFEERTILAPTLEVVETNNDYIMTLLDGEEKIDGINQDDKDLYSVEYLNSIKLSGFPNHCLRLKVDQSSRLCNGTRLMVTRLMTHTIEAVIISGMNIGFRAIIARLLLTPSDVTLPFNFKHMHCFSWFVFP
ncbi:hypothetical protein V2J09_021305 [Rumex salicifolius]